MKPEDLFAELEESSPAFRKAWAREEPRMRVAQNVYHLRTERGYTQAELARRAAMRQPRIAEIERGDAGPTQDTLVRIALALGVDIADLYERTDRPAPRRSSRTRSVTREPLSVVSAERDSAAAEGDRRDEPAWVKRLRDDGFDVKGGEGDLPEEPRVSF